MNDTSKLEDARAAREARASVGPSHGGSSTAAVAAVMRRYLTAERYHELQADEAQPAREQDSADNG
jgi:hypothetical protein